jgi:hypothetical protein
LEWSWPFPFVVPPCTQLAILRNRHKVPNDPGCFLRAESRLFRTENEANLKERFCPQSY